LSSPREEIGILYKHFKQKNSFKLEIREKQHTHFSGEKKLNKFSKKLNFI